MRGRETPSASKFGRAKMIFLRATKGQLPDIILRNRRLFAHVTTVLAIALTLSLQSQAQAVQTPGAPLGGVLGTVTDMKGDAVTGATVVLADSDPADRRTVVTGENGSFEFDDVKPALPYQIIITASGFCTMDVAAYNPGTRPIQASWRHPASARYAEDDRAGYI